MRYDPAGSTALGEPFLVDQNGLYPTVSRDGTLVYLSIPNQNLENSDREDQLIWVDRGGRIQNTLGQPESLLRDPAISPDGRYVAVGGFESGRDHGIYLIRVVDGRLEAVLRGHSNVILDLAFSANSRVLASASADRTARLWNVAARQCDAVLRGHREGVYAVAFDHDARRLATASLDGTARIWSALGTHAPIILEGHGHPLYDVEWSPDGRSLLTASEDDTARIWAVDGASEAIVLRGHSLVRTD